MKQRTAIRKARLWLVAACCAIAVRVVLAVLNLWGGGVLDLVFGFAVGTFFWIAAEWYGWAGGYQAAKEETRETR